VRARSKEAQHARDSRCSAGPAQHPGILCSGSERGGSGAGWLHTSRAAGPRALLPAPAAGTARRSTADKGSQRATPQQHTRWLSVARGGTSHTGCTHQRKRRAAAAAPAAAGAVHRPRSGRIPDCCVITTSSTRASGRACHKQPAAASAARSGAAACGVAHRGAAAPAGVCVAAARQHPAGAPARAQQQGGPPRSAGE
jgi:hypothetical protein